MNCNKKQATRARRCMKCKNKNNVNNNNIFLFYMTRVINRRVHGVYQLDNSKNVSLTNAFQAVISSSVGCSTFSSLLRDSTLLSSF